MTDASRFLLHPSLVTKGRGKVLQMLDNGEMVYGFGIRNARTTDIVLMTNAAGYHLIWMDLEHSAMSLDVCAQMSSMALSLGMTPIVRIPEREYGVIGRVLDGGALGIMTPRVETAEQAADLARACRFAPRGERSQIGAVPIFGMRKVPPPDHNQLSDSAAMVIVLIETERGVANAAEIAAVPGVDVVMIGSNDLSADMGIPGDYRHPRMREAYRSGIEACAKHGKHFAAGGLRDAAYQRELRAAGACSMLFTGIDSEMIRDAIHSQMDWARAAVEASA